MNVAKVLLITMNIVGWIAVIIGCLIAFTEASEQDLTGILAGIGIAASGLLICAAAQFMMATIVTAENTTEIKNLLTKLIDQNTKQDTQPKQSTGYPTKQIV